MVFLSAQCQGLKKNKPIAKLKNEDKPNKTLPNFRIFHNSLPFKNVFLGYWASNYVGLIRGLFLPFGTTISLRTSL